MKTSGRMVSDVAKIQVDKSLFSHFTAVQRAHVIIASFQLKLTGVF